MKRLIKKSPNRRDAFTQAYEREVSLWPVRWRRLGMGKGRRDRLLHKSV
jgi:hypothetical protein